MPGLFGGTKVQTIDTGAKAAAELQAQIARENAAREQQRWEREKAEQERIRLEQEEKKAKEKADLDAKLAKEKEAERIRIQNQAAAMGATGSTNTAPSDAQIKKEFFGFNEAMNLQKQAMEKERLLYPESNDLLSLSGFNKNATGGRVYR